MNLYFCIFQVCPDMRKERVIICCLFVCVLFVAHPHIMDMLRKPPAKNDNTQVFEIAHKKYPETVNEQIKYQTQYVSIKQPNEHNQNIENKQRQYIVEHVQDTKQQNKMKVERFAPPGNYMGGYFSKVQSIPDNDEIRVLLSRIPFYNREPSGPDIMDVGWVSSSDVAKFHKIGHTYSWNLQMGSMLEWINETHVIYNVRQNGFKAAVHPLTGNATILQHPVCALTKNMYISVSFDRLYNIRHQHGYIVAIAFIPKCPNNDGLWLVHLNGKNAELLLSYAAIREYLIKEGDFDEHTNLPHKDKVPTSDDYYWWVIDIIWSKDSKYISIIIKASTELQDDSDSFSALIIVDVEKRELWRVPTLRGGHSYFGSFLLSCEALNAYKIVYRKKVEELKLQSGVDGHCSLSPDEKWILTDNYHGATKNIILQQLDSDKKYVLAEYRSLKDESIYTRCDLHSRWSFDGKFVLFDSTHEGFRSVYSIDLLKQIPTYSIGKAVVFNTSINNFNTTENDKIPRYVYIDLGARNGDTIDWYLKTYPKRVPSIIWAFEANPQNYELMDKYWTKHRDLDIRVIKKAAWIDSKGVEFTLDNRPGVLTGGSMFNHNQAYLKNTTKVKVESVDFSFWLKNNTAATDDIMVKMDIEGAEYDILDKMFVDGTINRVKIIIIEWHDRFMPGKKHSYLTQKIKKLNIRLIEWH